jgi:hypothetical protein
MNAAGVLILTVLLAVVLTGPPSRALMGMMAGVLYLTQLQQVNVGGFNLYAFRLIELVGFVRVLARGEFSFGQLTRIDRVLLTFVIYTVVVYALRTTEGIAYRIGWGVDVILCYFAFRGLMRTPGDVRGFLGNLLILLIPYAALVLYESYTRHNLLAVIGGRVGGADMLRGGRLRACGSFRHPSLLGTLGATFLPIYIGLAFDQKQRKRAFLGIGACLAIVWASNSGGPLSCALVAIVGWSFWKLRARMSLVRRGIVFTLIALGFAMKAPIWYLIAKASSVTGGDGYHRSRLMEQAFNHLSGWWLAGMPIEETQHWFAYYIHGTGGADITNQFLSYGIAAGLGSMGFFIYLISRSISTLGATQKVLRVSSGTPPHAEHFLWGFGVMIIVHVFNWIGINYFDQTYAMLYLQLAAVVAVTDSTMFKTSEPQDPNPADAVIGGKSLSGISQTRSSARNSPSLKTTRPYA